MTKSTARLFPFIGIAASLFAAAAFGHCTPSPNINCVEDGGAHHCSGGPSDPPFCGGVIQQLGTNSAIGAALAKQDLAGTKKSFIVSVPLSPPSSPTPPRLSHPPGLPPKQGAAPLPSAPLPPAEFARLSTIRNEAQAKEALRGYADSVRSITDNQALGNVLKAAPVQGTGRLRRLLDLDSLSAYRQLKARDAQLDTALRGRTFEVTRQTEEGIDGARRNSQAIIANVEEGTRLFKNKWKKGPQK